jgi:hypothetical protein
MARNYRNRTPSYVTITHGGATLHYGFNSGLKDTDREAFGQTVIDFAAAPTGLAIGVNSPKPPKASKKSTTGYDSSFCSANKIATLRTAGYTVSAIKTRNATKTALATTFFLTIGGVKYAWMSPLLPAAITTAMLTALGVTEAGSEEDGLVFGASTPKPSRYVKEIAGAAGESINRFSIFVAPSKEDDARTAGWTKQKARKIFVLAA